MHKVFGRSVVFAAGGLGNQLFQWAFAHHLAESSNEEALLISIDRNIGLSHTRTGIHHLVSSCHSVKVQNSRSIQSFQRLLDPWKPSVRSILTRIGVAYQESPYNLPDQAPYNFFLGYFQRLPLQDSLIQHLSSELANSLYQKSGEFARSLSGRTVIHIRGGDFRKNYSLHPSSEPKRAYYEKALEECQVPAAKDLVVLTDDSDYAKKIIGKKREVLLLNPTNLSTYDALFVMSKSKSLIASTSTLSIWGAFLALRAGNNVFLPDLPSVRLQTNGFLLKAHGSRFLDST